MNPLHSFTKTILYSVIIVVGFLLTPLRATLQVDDGFDDGTRTAGTNPLAVSWYSMNGPGTDLSIVNDNVTGGINSGNALKVTPTVASEGIVGQFPVPVTLMNGQSVSLSFQFRFTGTTNVNQANLFRFGLLDSRGTPTAPPSGTGDNDAIDRVDDLGYYAATNPGLASATGTTLFRWGQAATTGKMTYGPTLTGTTTLQTTTTGASISAGTTSHWATMIITRSGTSLTFAVSIDGQASASGTETAPVTYVFDEIAIATGAGTVPSAFLVDNVQVNFSTIIASDGFDDGTRTATNPLKMNWYSVLCAGTHLTVVDDSAGIGSGFAMELAAPASLEGFIGNLPSTITLNDGDSITMIYDWRYTGISSLNLANRIRFGLYNSGGTRASTDNTGTLVDADDIGYFGGTNPGLASTTGTDIARDLAGGNVEQGTAFTIVGTAGTSVVAGTTPHYTVFTITRTGSTLTITNSIDGQTPATYTDTSPLTYSYDEIAFCNGAGGTPSPFVLDNVQVEYSKGHSAVYPGLGEFVGEGDYSNAAWTPEYTAFINALGVPAAYYNPSFCDTGSLHGVSQSMTAIAGSNATNQWANTTARNLTPIVSVPLANQSSKGNETAAEADFAAIVAGTYDVDYNKVFSDYEGNWSTIYLRIGWEQNDSGSNYPWYCAHDATASADYIAAWKHVANLAHTFMANNPGKVIKTVWCPATCNFSATSVTASYPADAGYIPGGTGDQYVDVIAMDVYSQVFPSTDGNSKYFDWGTDTEDTTTTIFATGPGGAVNRAHWLDFPGAAEFQPANFGGGSLAYAIGMAQTHLKPLAIPETGSGNNGTTNGPVDDPVMPLYEADRLSQAIAVGTQVQFVALWDNGSNFQFTTGTKPNQLAAWQQFIDDMAALTP